MGMYLTFREIQNYYQKYFNCEQRYYCHLHCLYRQIPYQMHHDYVIMISRTYNPVRPLFHLLGCLFLFFQHYKSTDFTVHKHPKGFFYVTLSLKLGI